VLTDAGAPAIHITMAEMTLLAAVPMINDRTINSKSIGFFQHLVEPPRLTRPAGSFPAIRL
jgi:hypothetical protein